MSIVLVEKISLGLENRDGELMIGMDKDGGCYLILSSVTFMLPRKFEGIKDGTTHLRISKTIYHYLRFALGSK